MKIYRLSAPLSDYAEQLQAGLKRHGFQPGTNLEMRSIGWLARREGGELAPPLPDSSCSACAPRRNSCLPR